MKRLIVIGAGGHGKVIVDIAKKVGYKDIAFLDDNITGEVMGIKVVGKIRKWDKFSKNADFFVAVGNNKIRKKFIEELMANGETVCSLIHPSAVIGTDVEIGYGTCVMAGVVINPCVKIGKGVIVNTSSSVDHDSNIGDYCHIAVGCHVTGTVNVGDNCFLGAGSVIKNNINVCSNCVLGAGAVVVKDIEKEGTYIGIPAKIVE